MFLRGPIQLLKNNSAKNTALIEAEYVFIRQVLVLKVVINTRLESNAFLSLLKDLFQFRNKNNRK